MKFYLIEVHQDNVDTIYKFRERKHRDSPCHVVLYDYILYLNVLLYIMSEGCTVLPYLTV